MTSQQINLEDAQAHVSRTLDLLAFERETDLAQTSLLASKCSPKLLEQRGLAILNLQVSSISVGLGGKTLVELERFMKDALPSHSFRNGDTAEILAASAGVSNGSSSSARKGKGKESDKENQRDGTSRLQGVVYRVHEDKVVLALDSSASDDGKDIDIPERCRQKLANTVTYDRMEKTLKRLSKLLASSSPPPPDLVEILFGLKAPSFTQHLPIEGPLMYMDENLNDSQKEAVKFAVYETEQVALIHGPPGTGKTSTLIECIRHLVRLDKRILVCSASNLAVDNILERLSPHLPPHTMSRLGHPARILPSLMRSTLDYQMAHSNSGQVTKELKQEMEDLTRKLTSGKVRGKERREGWQEMRELRKEYRKRESGVVKQVVGQARVVLATCHGAGSRQLDDMTFDVLIIDEAAQALEAVCWIPLLRTSKKVILAGDHLQLPPTIKSVHEDLPAKLKKQKGADGRPASPATLGVTLFDRLLTLHGDKIKRLLNVQYRMNEKIMAFPSAELYDDKLVAHEAVATRLLSELPQLSEAAAGGGKRPDDDDGLLSEPVIFYDTAGTLMYERAEDAGSKEDAIVRRTLDGESKSNENEAEIAMRFIDELVQAGVPHSSIAVITPYNAQVSLITTLLRNKYPISVVLQPGRSSASATDDDQNAKSPIECGSVDGFQGREKDVIVLSLVRSNDKKEVGFLSDKRRLNVAMTRAKRCLCVIGDSETVAGGGSKFLKDWMAWLEDNADVRFVQ